MTSTLVADSALDRLRGVVRQLAMTRRLVRLLPVLAAAAVGAIVVWRLELASDTAEVLLAAALAVGVAPALSDPASVTLASSPTSPGWRAVARLALVVPLAVSCWLVARVLTSRAVGGASASAVADLELWVPGWDPVLVAATFAVAALAAEVGTGSGAAGDVPGLRGSILVLLAAAVSLFLPPSLALVPIEANRWRWLAIALLGSLALVLSLADSGRQRPTTRGRWTRVSSARTTDRRRRDRPPPR